MSRPELKPAGRVTRFAIVVGLLVLLVLYLLTHREQAPAPQPQTARAEDDLVVRSGAAVPPQPQANPPTLLVPSALGGALATTLSERLQAPSARAHEAILLFTNADGYRRFISRATQAGVIIVGQIDALKALRVRVRAYDDFAAALLARAADFGGISGNPFVDMPGPPALPTQPEIRYAAVGQALLATIGVPVGIDNATWGRGVTIAILDGGAAPDPTLGARLRYLDIGLGYAGTGAAGHHGTAVTSLVAGAAADASGIAPAANVLSIRVMDTDDRGDVFTVCQGIVAAVDAGAQIINLSLGGWTSSELLNRAITYADAKHVVLVAAAGNNGADRLVWPAADPRVISVGATDATGRQTAFSNSGEPLHLTAPGVGIQAAGLNQERTLFSGTSASAPIVSGAIATLLSQTPGLTPAQAVEILQTHADDRGALGRDAHYGYGNLDLGWALARDDLTRTDVAIASHAYNEETHSLEVVVQNRSAHPVPERSLTVELNGHVATYPIPILAAGQSSVVSVPIDATTAAAPIEVRTLLVSPPGEVDAVPVNNTRNSLFDLHQ